MKDEDKAMVTFTIVVFGMIVVAVIVGVPIWFHWVDLILRFWVR